MGYKALILDLDGTLVESLPGIANSLNLALAKHGFPCHDITRVRSFIGDGTWMLVRKSIQDAPDSTIEEVTESFKQAYDEGWKAGTEVFAGFMSLLITCVEKEIKLAVLSNKPHHYTSIIVQTLFPEIPFVIVLGQQEGMPKKPAPDGTLLCLERLGVSPEQTLFIGDSTVDMQTAKAAGLPCAAVTWGYHDQSALEAEGANYFANSIEELAQIIVS
jgi:phosphoglycolate phosphatase